ncbi:MAG: DNA-binding transcriptional regulator OxyR [Actinomycetales bacterium]|nr:MAG: DNA-binding transcriptional regulator OxyR [Actinomycetales bacterium]
MNLRDLEYLAAVADHRHFGKAAEACYVSQPTLSTQLKKLEAELGVELIERAPRHVMLTPAGERVVARARVILAEVDAIRGIARHAQDPRAGTLRLGAFPTIAPYLLPHVVPQLRRELPALELLLAEEKTPILLDQLRAGRLDAAVLALPVDDDSVYAEPLFREEFVLAVPADHRLAGQAGDDRKDPVGLDALVGERVLLLADGHCLRDQALAVCHTAGVEERDGFRATSLETLRHMVGAGAGVTLLPVLSVTDPVPPSSSVVLRQFNTPAPHRDIALVWRRSSVFGDLLLEVARVLRQLPEIDGLARL